MSILQKKHATRWLFPLLLMFIAAFIRFRFDTAVNYLLVGSDGPYYPLQVRSLLEHGRLAFADMPLIFVIEAFLAKILQLLHVGSLEESVVWAVQCVDIVLPPLAAIPVCWIAWELSLGKGDSGQSLPTFQNLAGLILAFSIFNYTTVWAFMNSGLQKNALAIVWVFGYLYYAICYLKRRTKPDLYKAMGALLLCALTHFGCFSIVLGFTVLLGIFYLKPAKFLKFDRFQWLILSIIPVLLTVLYYFDAQRFERLCLIPLKIFQNPIYRYVLKGDHHLNPMNLINGVVFNILGIFALALVFFYRKTLDNFSKKMGIALAVFTLFLASPFIGIEWYTRLNIMAFIPLTVLYLLLFQVIPSKWVKLLPALSFAFLLIIALSFATKGQRTGDMTDAAFAELMTMRDAVQVPPKAVTIGRQDHRLLASWVLRTRNCADYYFQASDFGKYDAVYVLHQLKGNNLTEARFNEKPVPPSAKLIFKGEYFELYQLQAMDN